MIEGKWYGVHAFVAWIWDKKWHDLVPGVVIGDCGLKMGTHGIDNGFLVFQDFRIPMNSLLDWFC